MKAHLIPNLLDRYDDMGNGIDRGDYEFAVDSTGEVSTMLISCPGCGEVQGLPLKIWSWNGNRELPTLSPSINHVGCWHGWLIAGEFIAC